VLVAAVLGPEKREDGELEVVGFPLEQLLDTVELAVGQAERAVERLFRDRAQGVVALYRPRRIAPLLGCDRALLQGLR
jgi:hypothetical protein